MSKLFRDVIIIKEKALNALNNLSVNVENQIKIKVSYLKLQKVRFSNK